MPPRAVEHSNEAPVRLREIRGVGPHERVSFEAADDQFEPERWLVESRHVPILAGAVDRERTHRGAASVQWDASHPAAFAVRGLDVYLLLPNGMSKASMACRPRDELRSCATYVQISQTSSQHVSCGAHDPQLRCRASRASATNRDDRRHATDTRRPRLS